MWISFQHFRCVDKRIINFFYWAVYSDFRASREINYTYNGNLLLSWRWRLIEIGKLSSIQILVVGGSTIINNSINNIWESPLRVNIWREGLIRRRTLPHLCLWSEYTLATKYFFLRKCNLRCSVKVSRFAKAYYRYLKFEEFLSANFLSDYMKLVRSMLWVVIK